jgi:hypothetical protein
MQKAAIRIISDASYNAHTWLTNEARHQREDLNLVLRNSANLQIPFARLAMTRRQPLVQLPKLWCENKLEFNAKLKKF